jgi:hypothetical protein
MFREDGDQPRGADQASGAAGTAAASQQRRHSGARPGGKEAAAVRVDGLICLSRGQGV